MVDESNLASINRLKYRLDGLFSLIEKISFFDSKKLAVLLNDLDAQSNKINIEYLANSESEEFLGLRSFRQIRLVYHRDNHISFQVDKQAFCKNFDTFYFPGDDITILKVTEDKIVCYLDHEEFAVVSKL